MCPPARLPTDAPTLRARLAEFVAARLLEPGAITAAEIDAAYRTIAEQLAAEASARPDARGREASTDQ